MTNTESLIIGLRQQVDYERKYNVDRDDHIVGLLEQAANALEALRTRAALAEAGLPGMIFSKRKALVERCAEIAETCELFNGDRLKNSDPRVTVAATIRELGLSSVTSGKDS